MQHKDFNICFIAYKKWFSLRQKQKPCTKNDCNLLFNLLESKEDLGRRLVKRSLDRDIAPLRVIRIELDYSRSLEIISKLIKIETCSRTQAMLGCIALTILEQSCSQSIREDKLLGNHIRIHVVFELNALIPGYLLYLIEVQAVERIVNATELKNTLVNRPTLVDKISGGLLVVDNQCRLRIINLAATTIRGKGDLLVINDLKFSEIIKDISLVVI